jgi:hypothetical protein
LEVRIAQLKKKTPMKIGTFRHQKFRHSLLKTTTGLITEIQTVLVSAHRLEGLMNVMELFFQNIFSEYFFFIIIIFFRLFCVVDRGGLCV